MSTITAAAVNELRKRTDLPMMDCKKALQETGGDIEKAIEYLRIKMKGVVDKRIGNETAEGRIAVFIDPASQTGAIIEVLCESAPVVKSEHFVNLANDLAKQVALKDPKNVEELLAQPYFGDSSKTVADRLAECIGLIRENMKPGRFTRIVGGLMGEYIHHDASVGVLLAVQGQSANPQFLRELCMHIAAVVPTPKATRREEVPAEIVAKELEIAKAKAAETGKPPEIAQKIAEGQMKTWYAQNVLVEQPYIRDESKTFGQVAKEAGLEVLKFVRYKIGEAV